MIHINCSVWTVTRTVSHFCSRRKNLASCVACRATFCAYHFGKHKVEHNYKEFYGA